MVACKSACAAYNEPQYCCTGEFGSPITCKPTLYSTTFKRACPTAYSYAYDDATSTFTCTGANYILTFCPKGTWEVFLHHESWIINCASQSRAWGSFFFKLLSGEVIARHKNSDANHLPLKVWQNWGVFEWIQGSGRNLFLQLFCQQTATQMLERYKSLKFWSFNCSVMFFLKENLSGIWDFQVFCISGCLPLLFSYWNHFSVLCFLFSMLNWILLELNGLLQWTKWLSLMKAYKSPTEINYDKENLLLCNW